MMSAVHAQRTLEIPLEMDSTVSILNFGIINSLLRDERSMIGRSDPFFFGRVKSLE